MSAVHHSRAVPTAAGEAVAGVTSRAMSAVHHSRAVPTAAGEAVAGVVS